MLLISQANVWIRRDMHFLLEILSGSHQRIATEGYRASKVSKNGDKTWCMGRVLGIVGQNPSVSKSNQLHIVISRTFLYKLRYIPYIDSSLKSQTSNRLFFKLNRFVCKSQLFLPVH